MAHPYQEHRSDKIERKRVGKMFGPECQIERADGGKVECRSSGGAAMRYAREAPGAIGDHKQAKKYLADVRKEGLKRGGKAEMHGKKPKHRLDKRARCGKAQHHDEADLVKSMVKSEAMKRADGGRAKKGAGKTTINISVSPPRGDMGGASAGGLGSPPGALLSPVGAPPAPPPGMAAAAPGGGAPMPPIGGPPPGLLPGMMPPRAKGGRVGAGFGGKTGKALPAPRLGNAAKQKGIQNQGPGDAGGKSDRLALRNGTPVQHLDGKKDGSKLIGSNISDDVVTNRRRVPEPYDQYEAYRR